MSEDEFEPASSVPLDQPENVGAHAVVALDDDEPNAVNPRSTLSEQLTLCPLDVALHEIDDARTCTGEHAVEWNDVHHFRLVRVCDVDRRVSIPTRPST